MKARDEIEKPSFDTLRYLACSILSVFFLQVAGCSDEQPSSLELSCLDTRDCPSGQYCYCGGICVTPANCSNNLDCCDNEVCQSGLCLHQMMCSGDTECVRGRFCTDCYCAPAGCQDDQQCPADQVCEGGLCLDAMEFPCDGRCDNAREVCSPIRNTCLPIPSSCQGVTCEFGQTLIFEGLEERLGPGCDPPRCTCARAREVPPGWVGTEFSALHLAGTTFAVLAHDHRYGDLVSFEVLDMNQQTEPFHVDGIPDVAPRGLITGRRSGIYEPGPVRGAMPSAAVGLAGLGVAYHDLDEGSLRFAQRYQDGTWFNMPVDSGGTAGIDPAIAVLPDGRWIIVYFARSLDRSYLRMAFSMNTTPTNVSDWALQTIDEGLSLPSGPGEDIPTGIGLSPAIAVLDNRIFVSYYDSIEGNLRLLFGPPPWPFTTVVLDSGSTRSGISGSGDVGLYNDIAVTPQGDIGVAYVDRISSEIWYLSFDPYASFAVEVPFVRTPEIVDPGRDAVPPLMVGAGLRLAFNYEDEPMVIYQDSTNADLILSISTSHGWAVTPVARQGAGGFSPHIFTNVEGQTWVLHGVLTEGSGGNLIERLDAMVIPF